MWSFIIFLYNLINVTEIRNFRRVKRSAFSIKFMNISEKISSVEKPSVKSKNPRISFSKSSDLTTIASNLFKCPKNKTESECANKTLTFKSKVIQELTKSVGRSDDENNYNVNYQSATNKTNTKSTICILLKNKIKLVRRKDPPFMNNKLGQSFPKRKLFRKNEGKSCIIVSSAGSMSGSNLGKFIGKSLIYLFTNMPLKVN
jgi:hypothetical protein